MAWCDAQEEEEELLNWKKTRYILSMLSKSKASERTDTRQTVGGQQ